MRPKGPASGDAILMLCSLAGLAPFMLFLVPRTVKHTVWVLLLVLALSVPLFITERLSFAWGGIILGAVGGILLGVWLIRRLFGPRHDK